MTIRTLMTLLLTALAMPSISAADYETAGTQTEYFTMVTSHVVKRHCNGEGNQITGGELVGDTCRPIKQKYCRWGIGSRNNCLIPCVDAAGKASDWHKTKKLRHPMVCKYGPFAGKTIRYVRIADVGGAVQGGHVDVFQGLCLKEHRNSRGRLDGTCETFGEERNYASYRGSDKYDETYSTVMALINQMGGSRTADAASASHGLQQMAELQTGTTMR